MGKRRAGRGAHRRMAACACGRDKARPSQNLHMAHYLRIYGRAALRRGRVLQLPPYQFG